ncbi:MAG: HEAT repeat domain-containing protein [Bacteroidetes bacterium]|nr:HEAT repeat domain-containing protein [Bacteroidota bacterium]
MIHRNGRYPTRSSRGVNFLRSAIRLFLCGLQVFLIGDQAVAQEDPVFNHPLFTGPIREAETSPIDVRHVRIDVFVDPVEHRVTGRFTASFRRVEVETFRIAVSTDSAAALAAILHGPELHGEDAIEWEDGQSYLRLPEQTVDAASDYYVSIEIDQSARFDTFPLGVESGPWTAVWTSSESRTGRWLPFSVSLDDWFTADIRISVPIDWAAFLPGTRLSSIPTEDRIVHRSAILSPGPATQIGFSAGARVSVSTAAPRFASMDSRLDADRLNSLAATTADIHDFITDRTNVEVDSSRLPFLQGFLRGDTGRVRLSLLPPTMISMELNSVVRDHSIATRVARAWLRRHMHPPGWTDIWVQEALSEFMALAYVREKHGEIAYMDELWELRRRYIEEFDLYQRPLVWDRWEAPEDMLDEHARGKGAWILHMLDKKLGTQTIFDSIGLLAVFGRDRSIGTEELRYALESRSHSNLSDFFDQWVYGAGHPVLDFEYTIRPAQDEIELTILQRQSGHLVPASFAFDLDVEASSLAGVDRSRLRVSGSSSTISMPVSLRPQYVRLDPDGRILFEFDRPRDASVLVSEIRRAQTDASRYLAIAMLRETAVDPSLLLGLRPVLSDPLPQILRRDLLEILGNLAPSTSAMREILSVVSDSSGWIRAAAISALESFTEEPEARKAAFDAANSEQNPVVLAAAVRTLVHLDPTLAWRVLQSAMVTRSDEDIVRQTAVPLVAASDADDSDKLELLLPLLESDVLPKTRAAAVAALCNRIGDLDIQTEILAVWPTAHDPLRSTLLDCIEQPATRAVLGETARGKLSEWSRFEPNPILLRRLSRVLQDTSS